MATKTFEVGDGGGDVGNTGADWTNLIAEGSGSYHTGKNDGVARLHNKKDGATFTLARVSLICDTSSLTNDCTIISATWTVKSTDQIGTDTYELALVGNTQANNTALADVDFDQFGSTEYAARQTVSGASQTFTFTLNATGLAAISKTSYTKMGLRGGMDLDDSDPTGDNHIQIDWGATDTYLTVIYTLPSIMKPNKYW